MVQVAPGIAMIDTMLAGWSGITAAYLVDGQSPALVETGAQTSAESVRQALADAGLAPEDLAWIVLTHIHLDHCGAVGDLAQAFPKATVVVHRRGARHLAEPERLVTASAAVYGKTFPLIGGLTPTPADRVVAVEDGHRIPLGGTRELIMIEAPGHARHHMAVLDETTGALMAGDALGLKLSGAGLYPTVPPPDFDLDDALATLTRLADIEPATLLIGHYGPVPDPQEAMALAAHQQFVAAGAALDAWRAGADVAAAIERALPFEETVADPVTIGRLRALGWIENNASGLAKWASERPQPGAIPEVIPPEGRSG